MTPSVSVIMPVYNRADRVQRAVASVLAQTLPVAEVIIVDDGSTDSTPEFLPRQIASNPIWRHRVRYFRQANQGPNVARNRAIAEAKGQWLGFCDDDDLWLPQKLEWQFRALDQFENRCAACITDAWFMNNPAMKMTLFQLAGKRHPETIGLIAEPLPYMLDTKSILGVHPVWLQNLLVRTDLVRRVGAFDARLRCGEDDDLMFRIGCETAFCFVSMPMVLIDRTPPRQRHIAASEDWDNEDFRLLMAQQRFEKRIGMGQRLSAKVRNSVRRDLAAVHSGWANWFLQKSEYTKAQNALHEAAKLHLTLGIALKWGLTGIAPGLARRAVSFRHRRRMASVAGLG